MKRSLLMLLLAGVLLVGCGSEPQAATAGGENVVTDNRTGETTEDVKAETAEETENKEDATSFTDADFETTGYLYENSIGDSLYFVSVKNHSNAVVKAQGNASAKNEAGDVIGAADMYIDVLGPGEETVGYFYFDSVTGIDTVEYSLAYEKEYFYAPVIGNLNVEQHVNDQNLTVTVTNAGEINAQFVEAYALFFDGDGKVVGYSSNYVTDGDSEIKPGATLSGQLDCYSTQDGYDSVKLFLKGRSDGSSTPVSEVATSEDDFEVQGYLYESEYAGSTYFIVVKNNSQEAVKVNGNATAKDAEGKTIGADDMSIEVVGPGETASEYFYFSDVKGIDTVEYQLTYGDPEYYKPVVGDLSVEESVNDKNVVVTVTNNGENPAQFVEAYALFFDANDALVSYATGYVTDDDSEIKPGVTLSEQLDSLEVFDHCSVYFKGRYSNY